MSFRIAIALGAIAMLCGCNTVNQNIGSEDPAFGEAVKYNAAIQIINPDPVYPPGGAMPGDSGDRGAKAVKRYRTDSVKQLETMSTGAGSSAAPR
jgi:type IV pilus biogenesis protein CpaD/CtpE